MDIKGKKNIYLVTDIYLAECITFIEGEKETKYEAPEIIFGLRYAKYKKKTDAFEQSDTE